MPPLRDAAATAALVAAIREQASTLRAAFPAERAKALAAFKRWPSGGSGHPVSITTLHSLNQSVRPSLEGVRDLGLAWLAAHESRYGGWSGLDFDDKCGILGAGRCDGVGSAQFDVGLTGLALLCFLRSGQGPDEGPYAPVVREALRVLTDVQSPEGDLGAPYFMQSTYDHMIGTLALLEALPYDTTGALRGAAERAVACVLRIRNDHATWRYRAVHPEMARHPNDVSVTGWAVQALARAREAHIEVDAAAFRDVLAFLDELTDPTNGRTGYYEMGQRPARQVGADVKWPYEQTESMTASALLARLLINPKARIAKGSPEAKSFALIAALPPVWSDELPGRRDYYYWLHGTEALARHGGTEWQGWRRDLSQILIEQVTLEGDVTGSWAPELDPWGSEGGRIYSTSALVLATIEAIEHE